MKKIHLKDIKKDQIFYECDYGAMLKAVALEDAYESGKMDGIYTQWKCQARLLDTGEEFGLLVTENHEHYGPKLYVESEVVPNDYPVFEVSKITGDKTELCIVGNLMHEPTVDSILGVIDEQGIFFRSSKIQSIEIIDSNIRLIKTKNSTYKLKNLK